MFALIADILETVCFDSKKGFGYLMLFLVQVMLFFITIYASIFMFNDGSGNNDHG